MILVQVRFRRPGRSIEAFSARCDFKPRSTNSIPVLTLAPAPPATARIALVQFSCCCRYCHHSPDSIFGYCLFKQKAVRARLVRQFVSEVAVDLFVDQRCEAVAIHGGG